MVRKFSSGLAAKLAVAAIAMVLTAGIGLAGGRAMAQSAAGTDAEIRPDFGALIRAPVRHWRPHPGWGQGGGYGSGGGYGWQGGPSQQYQGVWAERRVTLSPWRADRGMGVMVAKPRVWAKARYSATMASNTPWS